MSGGWIYTTCSFSVSLLVQGSVINFLLAPTNIDFLSILYNFVISLEKIISIISCNSMLHTQPSCINNFHRNGNCAVTDEIQMQTNGSKVMFYANFCKYRQMELQIFCY